MRVALALFVAGLMLVGAAAPHEHGSALGTHACAACVAAGGEEASRATPDVTPHTPGPPEVREPYAPTIAHGAPLGAVPGQSPPAVA